MSFGNPLLISLQIVQLPGKDAVLGIFALEHCGAVDENGTSCDRNVVRDFSCGCPFLQPFFASILRSVCKTKVLNGAYTFATDFQESW